MERRWKTVGICTDSWLSASEAKEGLVSLKMPTTTKRESGLLAVHFFPVNAIESAAFKLQRNKAASEFEPLNTQSKTFKKQYACALIKWRSYPNHCTKVKWKLIVSNRIKSTLPFSTSHCKFIWVSIRKYYWHLIMPYCLWDVFSHTDRQVRLFWHVMSAWWLLKSLFIFVDYFVSVSFSTFVFSFILFIVRLIFFGLLSFKPPVFIFVLVFDNPDRRNGVEQGLKLIY